jgi:NADPH:quinone reductase-like Zn-dependent oxidoreductase
MLAVRYYQHGEPEVLQCEEIPKPVPAAGEVLVRVETAAGNILIQGAGGGVGMISVQLAKIWGGV